MVNLSLFYGHLLDRGNTLKNDIQVHIKREESFLAVVLTNFKYPLI